MKPNIKDETRWLARLFGVQVIVLNCHFIVSSIGRFRAGQITDVALVVGLVIEVLLFWLGWCFLKSPSLWAMSSGLSKMNPYYIVFKCRYFDINKHIRCGLIAGLMAFILQLFMQLMSIFYKGAEIFELIKRIFMIIFWPPRALGEIFNLTKSPPAVLILFVILYLFLIGFFIGFCLSHLKHWLVSHKAEQTSLLKQLHQRD